MHAVYSGAGLDPRKTGFVEAHGTGTKVGDPIEAAALHAIFGKGRTPKRPILIGSVKANIGHLERASGIVTIIEATIMQDTGFVLPNADFANPNSNIAFKDWNMKVSSRTTCIGQGTSFSNCMITAPRYRIARLSGLEESVTQASTISASAVQTRTWS